MLLVALTSSSTLGNRLVDAGISSDTSSVNLTLDTIPVRFVPSLTVSTSARLLSFSHL